MLNIYKTYSIKFVDVELLNFDKIRLEFRSIHLYLNFYGYNFHILLKRKYKVV